MNKWVRVDCLLGNACAPFKNYFKVEWSVVERDGVEWSGVDSSGVEWDGVERRGVEWSVV